MAQIQIKDLTFYYEGSYDLIFDQASFTLDTDWKLGLIGRNGRGKTTLLRLLLGEYEYTGTIASSVSFDYFPFQVEQKERNTIDIIEEIYPEYELWEVCKEIGELGVEADVLYRPFQTLSNGEQTKVLLSILFLKQHNFLLIDEPTNHLDQEGRECVANYLNRKKGFILVSHDRTFLDRCIDHVMSINKQGIQIVQGNFTTWYENKQRQDEYEFQENKKLKKEIRRLEEASKKTEKWSNEIEKTKKGHKNSGSKVDRGYIGHKSAKMMKRSKVSEFRMEQEIEKKKKLLKNVEDMDTLKIYPLKHYKNELIRMENATLSYGKKEVISNLSFQIRQGEVTAIEGKNGCGKSTLIEGIRLLANKRETYNGKQVDELSIDGQTLEIASGLVLSYVPQDTSFLKGSLDQYIEACKGDPTVFKMLLRKLDFSREHFQKPMESYSAGQKKKVLLAKSLSEKAHLYIWDEPLNYIDIFSRIQIENLIKENHLTMLVVEHDKTFLDHLVTKQIQL